MSKLEQQSSNTGKAKLPLSVLLVMLVLVLVCLIAIIVAVNLFASDPVIAEYLLLFGLVALVAAGYGLIQVRRRVMSLRIELPPVTTTIECKKCGFKTVRAFERGDFVFKEVDKCQKCNDKMLVTAIYREISEKEKEKMSPV